MKKTKTITFPSTSREFSATLNKRVNDYFRVNKISRFANSEMIIKTFFMFIMYLLPYGLIITGAVSGFGPILLLLVVMSLGLAGIGLSVMHDANHGAYSKKRWVNTLLGYSINFIGANSFTWKIQHNVIHHSFTNIHEADEDISPRGVLRLTPHSRWRQIHRYQFIYAWFLYGLMTLVWVTLRDFTRIIKYHKTGVTKKNNIHIGQAWSIMIGSKIMYVGYMFIVPLILTSFAWWQILLGIVLVHYLAGLLLAIIFQSAHVVEGTEFPLPDENHELQNSWVIHQLHTTANFGNKSRWFTWYVGGLNFQIEHHLFPNICHVHYRKIAGIVQQTAAEYGIPYKKVNTFIGALLSHARLLRQLGMKPT